MEQIETKVKEDFVVRMEEEQAALKEKLLKLHTFIETEKFRTLDSYQKQLLIRQYEAMTIYFETLTVRLSLNQN